MAEVRFLLTPARVAAFGASAERPGRRGPGPVRWRLMGRNNRELGRSAQVFLDQAACRGAVVLLRRRIGEARPVVTGDGSGRWVWRLHLDGAPVAVVGRSYPRRRECLDNLRQFLAAVESAGVVDGSGPPPLGTCRREPAARRSPVAGGPHLAEHAGKSA